MSGLREALVNAIREWEYDFSEDIADGVLRVLGEHGDTQQVREQVAQMFMDHELTVGVGSAKQLLDAVMAVVTPRLAALNERAKHGDTQQVREQVIRILSTSRAGLSVDALDAIMAVVAPRLAAAVERERNLHQVVTEWHDRAERAEADLAAAQMQVRVRDARLDQVRMIVLDPEFPDVKPDGPVMTKLRRILDASAGYDAKERT